ncbi:hypothetical protein [Mycobacterium sp.]|uniref:hypothetical protein n=1 Tax=Mycobacterium sp. TaxID=1785 RepID=UPI003BB0D864
MNSTESAYERLIAALEATGNAVDANGSSASAECPVPDHGRGRGDQHPSLRLTDAAGKVLIHCFAGCDTADVLAALNLKETDLFNGKGGIDYIYNGGRKVRRKPGKKFVQSGNTQDNSLFQVEDIGDAETVYVVEGEQDAANVAKIYGVSAVSPPCGAKTAASKWNWEPLTGKHVVIVADKDKDETGSEHADDVAAQLHNAASVRIVESAVGKDISDHIAAWQDEVWATRLMLSHSRLQRRSFHMSFNNYDPPGTQYASTANAPSVPEGWRSLAHKTGLSLQTVAALGFADNLSCLFGSDNRLRDGAELRSAEARGTLFQQPTVEQRYVELYGKRWPRKRLTPQQMQLALEKAKWAIEGK